MCGSLRSAWKTAPWGYWVACALIACLPARGSADATLGVVEATPLQSASASAGVAVGGTTAVHALQVDVLFEPTQYDVFGATLGDQGGLTQVEAREVAPGQLRVVVFRAPSTGLDAGLVFTVPLQAKAGVVDPFPIVLTNYLLVGEDAAPVTTRLVPQIRLLTLRDGDELNGRFGLELSVDARATGASVTRVEYYVGGVLIGEGSGANFVLRWNPPTSGPFEIYAVAYDSEGNVASSRTVPIDVAHVGTYNGAIKGTYVGLIRAQEPAWDTAGYVTMTSATTGAFTFRVLMGGKTVNGKGVFDVSGVAVIAIPRKGTTPLAIQLTHSSVPEVDQIVGRLTDGTFDGPVVNGGSFVTEFKVDRLIWHARARPATAYAGAYTVLIPAAAAAVQDGAPPGEGYATAGAATSGGIKVVGRLADGEAISYATYLSKDGAWPLYKPLYRNRGLLLGEIALRETPDVSDGDGAVDWVRLANAASPLYPAGFVTGSDLIMSRYVKPGVGVRPLTVTHGAGNLLATVEDGTLPAPVERLTTMNPGGSMAVPPQGGERLGLAFNSKTGGVSGSFYHPQTGAKTGVGGVVFQKQNLAAGNYRTGVVGGGFLLEPHPDRLPQAGDVPLVGLTPLPLLAVTYPKAEAVVAPVGGVLTIRGTAKDGQGIAAVWCEILHDGGLAAAVQATGTTAWSLPLPIADGEGGRYTVTAKAVDGAGNPSLLVTRSFLVGLKKPLTVTVSGPGAVSRGFLGTTQRQVGQLVALTATPARGKRFVGWTGSVNSPARTISFLMSEGVAVEAVFTDP